jgi:hypothetical protein
MHPRAIPADTIDSISRQTTLDHILVPKVLPFSKEGLLDYIIQLVVSEDKAFQLVDRPAFRSLLLFLRPGLSERDIPHCTKIHQEIVARSELVVMCMQSALAKVDSKVSITFDTWTSWVRDPYIGVTAHYINSEWELKSEQLAFTPLEGDHSSSNIGSILIKTIATYGLPGKIRWFTANNATNNDTAIKAFSMLNYVIVCGNFVRRIATTKDS